MALQTTNCVVASRINCDSTWLWRCKPQTASWHCASIATAQQLVACCKMSKSHCSASHEQRRKRAHNVTRTLGASRPPLWACWGGGARVAPLDGPIPLGGGGGWGGRATGTYMYIYIYILIGPCPQTLSAITIWKAMLVTVDPLSIHSSWVRLRSNIYIYIYI